MKSRKSDDEIREEMAKHRRHINEYGERTDSVISRSVFDRFSGSADTNG